jgi:hypothetical protein
MVLAQLGDCSRIPLLYGTEQIFGLVSELIEVGTDGKVTIGGFTSGHDGPPLESCPGSAAAGEKEVRENLEL